MRRLVQQKPTAAIFYFFILILEIADPLSISAQNTAISVPIRVRTEQAKGVKNVTVAAFTDDTTAITSGVTNAEGSSLIDLTMGDDYRIKVKKEDEQYMGVTTYDIAIMIRHIQGIDTIPTVYSLIAADVDENGEIDGADIVHIRNFILRRQPTLPVRTWRFVDKSYVFKKPRNPFLEDFPEYIDFSKVSKETKGEFVAIKIGDVTSGFSARPALDNQEDDVLSTRNHIERPISMENIPLEAGKTYKIALNANLYKAIAYQMALSLDKKKAKLLRIEAADLENLTSNNYQLFDNTVNISWDGNATNTSKKLFYLTFLAEENALLSDILSLDNKQLRSLAFDENGNPMKLRLNFTNNKVDDADVFTVFQNFPNPVVATTTIGFNLPLESAVRFSVFDNLGKVVKTMNQTFPKGYNEVTLNKSDFRTNGILYYRLDTPQYSATKKMLVVSR